MIGTILRLTVFAVFLLLMVLVLIACAPKVVEPPEPIIITKEVERIVQVRCEDRRPPAPDYPDDDADLAAVANGDIFGLAQIYRAARALYRQRSKESDDQIVACAGR